MGCAGTICFAFLVGQGVLRWRRPHDGKCFCSVGINGLWLVHCGDLDLTFILTEQPSQHHLGRCEKVDRFSAPAGAPKGTHTSPWRES